MDLNTSSTTRPTFSPNRRTMHSSMEQPTSLNYASGRAPSPTMDAPCSSGVMHEVKLLKPSALITTSCSPPSAYASARPATPTMRRILWMKLSISLVSQERQMPKEA